MSRGAAPPDKLRKIGKQQVRVRMYERICISNREGRHSVEVVAMRERVRSWWTEGTSPSYRAFIGEK